MTPAWQVKLRKKRFNPAVKKELAKLIEEFNWAGTSPDDFGFYLEYYGVEGVEKLKDVYKAYQHAFDKIKDINEFSWSTTEPNKVMELMKEKKVETAGLHIIATLNLHWPRKKVNNIEVDGKFIDEYRKVLQSNENSE
ncbi:hypothetical protein PsorP6_007235 [Peronosclerospora sorghi]|uniref:Uncharacterized protein n=1 Tax=Peronosclerospora sorghi TaxID=230839 RepID=A0ACC0W9Q2_9STRA|nr:hypothetical protein PsorP6_007235 [Peronosclerospora sorghi]